MNFEKSFPGGRLRRHPDPSGGSSRALTDRSDFPFTDVVHAKRRCTIVTNLPGDGRLCAGTEQRASGKRYRFALIKRRLAARTVNSLTTPVIIIIRPGARRRRGRKTVACMRRHRAVRAVVIVRSRYKPLRRGHWSKTVPEGHYKTSPLRYAFRKRKKNRRQRITTNLTPVLFYTRTRAPLETERPIAGRAKGVTKRVGQVLFLFACVMCAYNAPRVVSTFAFTAVRNSSSPTTIRK